MRSDINIQEVIAGCLQSRPDCQRALVEHYSGLLYVICYRYLADTHTSQDALQESLTKIFLNLTSYKDSKGSFDAWATTITVRHCLNKIAEKKSRARNLIAITSNTEVHDLEKEMMTRLNADQLMELVADLPVLHRTVFNMAALDGYSHKDIAKELKITPINSRTLLKRARALLKDKIISQNKNESWVNTI